MPGGLLYVKNKVMQHLLADVLPNTHTLTNHPQAELSSCDLIEVPVLSFALMIPHHIVTLSI